MERQDHVYYINRNKKKEKNLQYGETKQFLENDLLEVLTCKKDNFLKMDPSILCPKHSIDNTPSENSLVKFCCKN